ncbi:MAG: fumarylacetoacetase [Flavobacteriales bacterium]|jgi:fumarylacetoacetase|nr:fumarylacetoacetase [Flavobacteriales bacterium]
MILANNPHKKSWISVEENSDFPIQNIPFGAGRKGNNSIVGLSRIGETAINLDAMQELGYFEGIDLPENIFAHDNLNPFLELTKTVWRAVRERISEIFDSENDSLKNNEDHKNQILIPLSEVTMEMPVFVGDYTDFYSSRQHAYNVGCMFRDPDNAIMPNWKRLPVGYHGRASSIILGDQDIYRPKGQQKAKDATDPTFGPSKRMDFELEMAFITGQGKPLGDSISTAEADDYIFGMVIFNDWSARDIQGWEYVPLGPFLGKNFASSISPWIVTLDALEPFRCENEVQDPKVLPYLEYEGNKNLDIKLEVLLQSEQMNAPHRLALSNYKYMYWNMNQQLAHHTINGCNINAGDMMASGTISGNDESAYGSMLELSWAGSKKIELPSGEIRTFIEDNDRILMRAWCKAEYRIGFGEINTKMLPAK